MPETSTTEGFEELLDHLTRTRGFQFKAYKRTSLERRILKRMHAVGIESFATYIDYLEVHPNEFSELFNTILINVTSFFRDPEAWAELDAQVIRPLVAQRVADGEVLRVWSAGCASGQEAYTLAMLIAEAAPEGARPVIKIYATDVDEDALQQARAASYGEAEMASVPEPFVQKYFDKVGSRFEFRKELRRWAIFGRHDLLRDAPISRIDILTCRNTLMYMNADLQEKIIARFHFALRGGALMLGKAEMLNLGTKQFAPLDLKQRIYQPTQLLDSALDPRPRPVRAAEPPASLLRVREQAFDVSPVAQLVVDQEGIVLLADQQARELFQIVPDDIGRPLQDLEVSYRPVELRSQLRQVYADRRNTTLKGVERVREGAPSMFFDVHLAPLTDERGGLLGAQVTFLDVTQSTRLFAEVRQSNRELETAYEELQSTSEELETTNEELQSTIEELETTTEELQSTNEELETMNEELQSTNEELQTVNDEIKQRGEDLSRTNQFMVSILSSLRAAVIVLDRELLVNVWNHEAEELWGLRADEVIDKSFLALDIGLPVEKLSPTLRAVFAQERVEDVVLEATSRRGKTIVCTISCTRLIGDAQSRGAVLVIETQPIEKALDRAREKAPS